jgi:hypothetical protein
MFKDVEGSGRGLFQSTVSEFLDLGALKDVQIGPPTIAGKASLLLCSVKPYRRRMVGGVEVMDLLIPNLVVIRNLVVTSFHRRLTGEKEAPPTYQLCGRLGGSQEQILWWVPHSLPAELSCLQETRACV